MNKRKALITSIITILILAIAGIVFASINSTQNNYAVEVVNDGSEVSTEDDNMKSQTKIINVNEDKDELTYETTLTNTVKATKEKELAIVVDTSYSMEQNSEGYDIKATAIDMATNILNRVNGSKVSVVDNTGIKIARTNSISDIKKAINGLTYSSGTTIEKGIEYAYSSFDNSKDNDKYVIIITDATDPAKAKLEDMETRGVKVNSILVDITSTEFGNEESPIPNSGKVYLMKNYSVDTLVNDINKIVRDITFTNKFNEEILKDSSKGNFNLEIIDSETDGTATINKDGTITWNIENISASESAKLKYKLKLNKKQT